MVVCCVGAPQQEARSGRRLTMIPAPVMSPIRKLGTSEATIIMQPSMTAMELRGGLA